MFHIGKIGINILITKEKGLRKLSYIENNFKRMKDLILMNFSLLKLVIITLSFILVIKTNAQVRVGEWGALTSTIDIKDIVSDDERTLLATSGGICQIKDNVYSIFTTVDGLSGVNISSINLDHQSNIWIGGSAPNGFVQIYDSYNQISINSFDFGLSSIEDIQVKGNICWVQFIEGQNVGIMKFIFDNSWEYRDSYKNYPSEAGALNCFIASDTLIYAGMDNGLYAANINDNIKDPNNWKKLIMDFDDQITSVAEIDKKLIFTTSTNIYEYDILNEILNPINFSYDLQNADNIIYENENIWFSDGENLYARLGYDDMNFEAGHEISKIYYGSNQIIVGTNSGFLSITNDIGGGIDIKRFIPNSPVTGKFSAIEVLDDGRLVGGSRSGISIYDEQGWRNILEVKVEGTNFINENYDYNYFIADTVPYEFGEYIADIEQGPDGLIYCAIRGSRVNYGNPTRTSGGIIIIDVDDPENITTIDTTYLSYYSSSGSSHYQIILDIEFDSEGNLWIVNPYCTYGNNPIHVRSPNGQWKHYSSYESGTRISQSPSSISFDNWGRAWVSAFQASEANLGIYPNGGISILSYSSMPYDPYEVMWKVIKNSGTVWSLKMGMNNKIYYLTPTGLNYFTIDNDNNPVIDENPYPYFPNISFGTGSKINIDAQGNIWANSTSEGLKILMENSTYWPDINGFHTENSPLLSNEVMDVAFDTKRNIVYIATGGGINTLKIPFGNPRINYENVIVFPSPFIIPSQKSMRVDNLPYESSMLITSLNGNIIRHVKSKGIKVDGNQLSWDGRDDNGSYVSSGVYLLLIYGIDGSRNEQKVTVIRTE